MSSGIFGDVVLEEFVNKPNQNKEKLAEILRTVSLLGGPEGTNALPYEQKPLELLCIEGANHAYPKLDLSFLSSSQEVVLKEGKFALPRFSIYPLHNEQKFSVEIHAWKIQSEKPWYKRGPAPDPLYNADVNFSVPFIFSNHLIKSVEFSKHGNPKYWEHRKQYQYNFHDMKIPADTIAKYRVEKGYALSFSTSVQLLFPETAREEIEKAEKLFKQDELYFIAESKPEDWNVTRVLKDPLIVGVKGKTCHYIHKFMATELEKLVSREFLE